MNSSVSLNTEAELPVAEGGGASIVVVGSGPVGLHFVSELARHCPGRSVLLFGEEETEPYDRVALSGLLQGETPLETLKIPIPDHPNLQLRLGYTIKQILPDRKMLVDLSGCRFHYETLVLATGSRPHVPAISGHDLPGTYRFRNLADVAALCSRQVRSRHSVILGGGLLGLEAARGMTRHGTRVSLVHHGPHLMNRQINEAAARRLEASVKQQGVDVRVRDAITAVKGRGRVESVVLRSGEEWPCDTLIYATGIRPNTHLASEAGIKTGYGIRIDDRLQTSLPDVYAIGECAEHRGRVMGLVGPGLEQAAVLAERLGRETGTYRGSILATALKVSDLPVFSAGTVTNDTPGHYDHRVEWQDESHYRALFLRRGRLVGAAGVGDWPDYRFVREAVAEGRRLWPWTRLAFSRTGRCFNSDSQALPDQGLLCNCRQVTVGTVRCALEQGLSLDQVCDRTGAAQVCGTCRPLIAQMADAAAPAQPVKRTPLVTGMAAAGLIVTLLTAPALALQDSVQSESWRQLWASSDLRQWTGYTMLGLAVLSLVLSAYKRIPLNWPGGFQLIRNLHLVLATLMLGVLVIHTGLRTGQNLNQWLLLDMALLTLLGAITAILAALEPRIANLTLKAWKRRLGWAHLLAFWPLPILLGYHIISVYYF